MKIFAPVKEIHVLRGRRINRDYTLLKSIVRERLCGKQNGKSKITRKTYMGVVIIEPFECVMNTAQSLIQN